MGLLIFSIILAVIFLWVILTYNGLISLKNQVANAWKQIDVQLKRRHDLIPNLVESVKGEMKFEKETLEKVIQARSNALSARGVADSAQKEGVLSEALGRLLAVVENYPNLKASENVKQLIEELTSTENKISFARQFYNDIATRFNIKQQVVPSNIIAGIFNFQPAELFEVKEQAVREAPKVNLNV